MFFISILVITYLITVRTINGYLVQNYYGYNYGDRVYHTNNDYPVQNYYDYDYINSPVHTNNNDGDFEIGDGDIYAGFMKKSYGMSGKINFNICKMFDNNNKDDCSYPGGEVTLFGGKRERTYVNIVPTKIYVKEAVKKAGISKVDNIRFEVTSFEDLDGKKYQKEVFHPFLVFRSKDTKVDFYTIFFDKRVIQAPKIRITKNSKVKIKSQYPILFVANNEDDYQNCNAEKLSCLLSNSYIDPTVYGKDKIEDSNINCNMFWIRFQLGSRNGNGNGSINKGNGNKNNRDNNIDSNSSIGNNNGNNNTRSYYIFDPDGVSKNCAGREPSRGSVVQLIIE